jgi:hypothetical protein
MIRGTCLALNGCWIVKIVILHDPSALKGSLETTSCVVVWNPREEGAELVGEACHVGFG